MHMHMYVRTHAHVKVVREGGHLHGAAEVGHTCHMHVHTHIHICMYLHGAAEVGHTWHMHVHTHIHIMYLHGAAEVGTLKVRIEPQRVTQRAYPASGGRYYYFTAWALLPCLGATTLLRRYYTT